MKNNQHMVLSLLNETAPEPGNVKFIAWSELFEELAQNGYTNKQQMAALLECFDGNSRRTCFAWQEF